MDWILYINYLLGEVDVEEVGYVVDCGCGAEEDGASGDERPYADSRSSRQLQLDDVHGSKKVLLLDLLPSASLVATGKARR